MEKGARRNRGVCRQEQIWPERQPGPGNRPHPAPESRDYPFFFFAWDSAEAAADLEAALDLPSLRTADATEATLDEVTFPGEAWERALPADLLEDLPVEELERTPEEVVATRGLVTFLAMTA